MLYKPEDFAVELEAQLPDIDLGVTDTRLLSVSRDGRTFDSGVIVRLDNGQEFLLTVNRWEGPRA